MSATFIPPKMLASISDTLKAFYSRLADTYDLFMAYLLLSRIDDDDKRTAALTTLALEIRSTPPPKPDKGEKA